MNQSIAALIFKSSWGFLIFIAILAQLLFEDQPKRKAGFLVNLIVIIPFVVVLVLFYLGRYFGTYDSTLATRISGTVVLMIGLIMYTISHFFLRRNWSLSGSVKENHTLVMNGPYKIIRHPMYLSMILVVLGSGFLIANYIILLFTPIAGIVYYLRSRKEEVLLKEEFPEYIQYAQKTRMLVPWIL